MGVVLELGPTELMEEVQMGIGALLTRGGPTPELLGQDLTDMEGILTDEINITAASLDG
jgi:hypothetical protein